MAATEVGGVCAAFRVGIPKLKSWFYIDTYSAGTAGNNDIIAQILLKCKTNFWKKEILPLHYKKNPGK